MRNFFLYFLFFFTNINFLSSYAQQPSEGSAAQKSHIEKEGQNKSPKKAKKTDTKKPKKKENQDNKILFAGTLLANPSKNIPANQFLFEPTLFFANTYGFYDAHGNLQKESGFFQYEILANLAFGLTRNLDCNFITSVIQTHVGHIDVLTTGDTVISLGLQLMREKAKSCRPDIRLTIGENFPTGKFDLLDFDLNGGDAAGIGSFETIIGLSVAKTVPIGKKHSIRMNPNFTFFLPSSIETLGKSIFGGATGIKGKAYPGNKFAVDVPFEYNITNSLIFGLDIFYIYNATTFFEHKTDFFQIELPASENFSLAPCFEYNPCERFVLQAAIWFSVSGRNSLAFTTAAFVGWWVF